MSRPNRTFSKVNRCLTEVRARFLKVYAEIEAGRCDTTFIADGTPAFLGFTVIVACWSER